MAGYGSWEDRPWGVRREGGQDRDRWRRDEEGWRERDEERLGRRGHEEWRGEDPERREGWRPEWRGAGEERRIGGTREPMHGEWRGGEAEWDRERSGEPRRYGSHGAFPAYGTRGEERFTGHRMEPWRGAEHGWRGGERDWRGERGREREWPGAERDWRGEPDTPWVDPGRERRGRDTRGMVEWEDRGPLAWLRDRFGTRGERPARGPKGYSRPDERIHEDVCERMARSGVDASEVEVKVESREVTLTGTVASREQKWWLEQLAEDAFGVEEVHNHLRVRRGEHAAHAEATDPNVRH
jgi:hypothetical protein